MKLFDRTLADPMIQSMKGDGEVLLSLPEDQRNAIWDRAQPSRDGYNDGATWEQLRVAEDAARIEGAIVFDVSNVAAYIEEHGFDPRTIPCWIPPYPLTWWETSKTSYLKATRGGGFKPTAIGALARVRRYKQRVGRDGPSQDPYEWHYDVYWSVYFLEPPKSHVFVMRQPYAIDLPMTLGEDGCPVADFESSYRANGGVWEVIAPFLMAIGFTHCKNVELIEGSRAEGALRKKQERKLGRPLTEFKELVIDPHMTQKRVEGTTRAPSRGHAKSLHIARGHFAHYSEDKPLFGKYTGTFWRPAHVRGSADVGTVYKDYKVKP